MSETIQKTYDYLESFGLLDEEILMHYKQDTEELFSFDNQLFKNAKNNYFYNRGLMQYKKKDKSSIIYLRIEGDEHDLKVAITKYITGHILDKKEKESIKQAIVEVFEKYYNVTFNDVQLVLGNTLEEK